MSDFGIDQTALEDQSGPLIPDMVPRRVLQLDADFTAYHSTYDPEMDFDTCKQNCDAEIAKQRILAGAETVHCHLTASGSTKGGRYDIAIQKPYQENRTGKEKPQHLEAIRQYMRDNYPSTYSKDLEADDTISIAQQAALDKDQKHLSIISSGDKDLCMNSGLHLCQETFEIIDVDGYGSIKILNSEPGNKKQTKVKGWGTSFFWAQMLMGDGADNIQGLVTLTAESYYDNVKPTKPWTAAGNNVAKRAGILAKANARSCGPVAAYALLAPCRSDREAAGIVIQEYKNTYGTDWKRIFGSEARLLWMRRWSGSTDDIQLFLGDLK